MKKMLNKVLAMALVIALGLSLVGGAFAAEAPTGTYDLIGENMDFGQIITSIEITLDTPVGDVTEEEIIEAFSVKVINYDRPNAYGDPYTGDHEFVITGASLSEDGTVITLEMEDTMNASTWGDLSFADYSDGYEITLTEALGDLTTDLELTLGEVVDPAANWNAVDPVAKADGTPTYAYRWFDPSEDYEMPETGYPIIVWIHGAGESGTDNNIQIIANRVTAWGEAETQDIFGGAYVVAPQCYSNPDITGGWGWNGQSIIDTIENFIAEVGEENVDRNRIVIGGCSMGGGGTINAITTAPDYFAAAFPICPAGTITQLVDSTVALLDLPIYFIHSVDDTTVGVEAYTLDTYDFLKSINKQNVYLGLFSQVDFYGLPEGFGAFLGHWSWVYVHNDFDGTETYWLDEYTRTDGSATYETTTPAELGYDSFKAWLADQVNPNGLEDPYFTRTRETTAFGESITEIVIHNMPYVKATVSVEEYMAAYEVEVTTLDYVNMFAPGDPVDVVREPIGYEVGEDRTSIIVKFGNGYAFTENGPSYATKVTLNGEELPYGGDDAIDTEKFEELEFTGLNPYVRSGSELTTMKARAYTPDKETYEAPEDGYPLVVWLHGGGEQGTDNRVQIAANDVPNWTEEDAQEIFEGAYILAPQNHVSGSRDGAIATLEVIEAFIELKGDIDPNRVYVGGCSYGGSSTWTMLRNFPNYFAAAFPICSGVTLTSVEATALNNTPIYIIASTGDSTGIPSGMINAYNTLKAAGNDNVHIALFGHADYEGNEQLAAVDTYIDHWSWVYVHEDFDGEGDDYDGKWFLHSDEDRTIEYPANSAKVEIKDGVLTYYYGENSVVLDGVTETPVDLGYTSFKAWLADQVNPAEYITVNKTVEAWGEIVSSITLNLETALVDEETIKVTVTANDPSGVETEYEHEIVAITPSEDGLTVTVEFDKGVWDYAITQPTTINYLGYEVEIDGRTITNIGEVTSDVDVFDIYTYTTPAYDYNGKTMTTMSARAFTPDKETYPEPENGYPLVVWVHGGGERGTDNRIQIAANDVPQWTEKETQDIFGGAYILAPQNHAYADNGENAPAATMSLILQFIEEMGDIDVTRIYIGGCSYGGRGTFEMIREYPNFFAAAYPQCASIYDASTFELLTEEELDWLIDLPIYMTVSSGDQAKYVMSMITFYNKMVELGKDNIHFAIFEHSIFEGLPEAYVGMLDHWSWTYVHDNYDAKGDDNDGQNFIDTSVDGTYNDGKIVVKDGVLTYYYTWEEEECEISLNGSTERPEDTGYETIKEWIAAQVNPTPSVFDDVTGEDENYDAIMALYNAGLTNGTSATTYEPEASLTRAEFMTFLARALEQTVDNTADTGFTDVPVNSWETGSVAWGVANGLIEGYGDGTFGPEDPITEEQVNLIVGRLLENFSGLTAADGQTIANATAADATRGQVASIINAIAENYTAPTGYWW